MIFVRCRGFAAAALIGCACGSAEANPLGGSVAGGSATIQGQGTNSVTINQASQNTVINWTTFNIGQGQTTTFNQPNSTSVALNRVIGGQGPSFFDGTLTANGRVFIVNGDGILFGPGSSINTAGFLAATNNIRNEDFMAGKYNFNIPGRPDASIVNLGASPPRPAASPPWWRRACAMPAPSRRRSAPSAWRPATPSRSISTATG
jgi:filamentous hemagglutinin family protein